MKNFRTSVPRHEFHLVRTRSNKNMQPPKKAWTSQERDLYYVLGPAICLCRLCGFFPLSVKGRANHRSCSRSIAYTVYGLILTFLELIGLVLSLIKNINDPSRQKSQSLITATMCLQFSLNTIMTLAVCLAGILNAVKIGNAIGIVNSQDSVLQKLGVRIDHSMEFKRICTHLGIALSLMMSSMTYDLACEMSLILSPWTWLAWNYPIVFSHLSTYLYGSILIVLRLRFAAINETLQKMVDELNSPVLQTVVAHQKNAPKIRLLATVHGIFCETTNNLTNVFSFAIITIVSNSFVILTTVLYFAFQELKQLPNSDYLRWSSHLNWGVLNVSPIIYLVIACTLTQNQADRTAELIHKFNVYGIDTPFTTCIQLFSMQLNHQKVTFSAGGFFRLDPSFIQSIIGAVTTYLIILIQFDSTPDATEVDNKQA